MPLSIPGGGGFFKPRMTKTGIANLTTDFTDTTDGVFD
jgi:hypothetical protein